MMSCNDQFMLFYASNTISKTQWVAMNGPHFSFHSLLLTFIIPLSSTAFCSDIFLRMFQTNR